MKTTIFIFIFLIANGPYVSAQDFLLNFVEENYKETQVKFSYQPLIYHSIQVNSTAGPKILILGGKNYNYRKWLRHYLSENKQFILKINQTEIDKFISSKIFKIDLAALHPFDETKWQPKAIAFSDTKILSGKNYFLVVDTNDTRNNLFRIIAQKMGYQSIFFKTGEDALGVFKLQPEKFKMIAIYHAIQGMPAHKLVEKIISIKLTIPIIVDTGYQNQAKRNSFAKRFSKIRSVHIKPVILNNLQNTIKTLVKNKA